VLCASAGLNRRVGGILWPVRLPVGLLSVGLTWVWSVRSCSWPLLGSLPSSFATDVEVRVRMYPHCH
jgi:hypothetical protein